jgi:hypothetical protein
MPGADQPYEVLGRVYAYKQSATIINKPSDATIREQLAPLAQELGAEAVMGFHTCVYNGRNNRDTHRWGSGLAVRSRDSAGAPAAALHSPLVVAVLPASLPSNPDAKPEVIAETMRWLREAAMYHLEQLGYFAYPATGGASAPSTEALAGMTPAEIDASAGPWSQLILCTKLEQSAQRNAGIGADSNVKLKVWLFSRSEGKTVWSSEGKGSSIRLELLEILDPQHEPEAMQQAMKEALATAPPFGG